MSFQIHILSEVDSTNAHALRLFKAKKAQYGDLFLALHQRQGQGQGNHLWESEAHKNLTFSFITPIDFLSPQHSFFLIASIALACYDYLSQHTANVSIKWVNDLYVQHHKIGGILIQTISKGTHTHTAIVGIGININQTHFKSTTNATSLSLLTGKSLSIQTELQSLLPYLTQYLSLLKDGKYATLHHAYNAHCYLRGQKVKISKGEQQYHVYFETINEKGQLIGKNDSGTLHIFSFPTARLNPLSPSPT